MRTTPDQRRDCIIHTHAELLREYGRPPSPREMCEVSGLHFYDVRNICRKMKLALSDGRSANAPKGKNAGQDVNMLPEFCTSTRPRTSDHL